MIQDGEHLISTTGEHEQVRCALANAAQWFRDYEQQHLAKDTSEGREKALTNAARAILCEEAAVLAGQLADEADRLQSSPKPSLPSREVVSPTEAEMESVGSAIGDELYERGNQHLKDAMGWLSDDDADAIACAAIRACRAFQPPSPLSDRVERLGDHHGLDNDRQVLFYEQDFYVLSNFSSFSLMWFGQRFDTSEAAYHWMKFPPEHAPKTPEVYAQRQRLLWAIQEAPSAHEAFKLAEANKHLRRADWDDVKVEIMRGILREKASQHEYVRRKLLATGDRELIENSWRDDFWGWGQNRDGQNMLGKLWMEVRSEIARAALGDGERE